MGKRATVAHFTPGEKFEAPTPSDSHARRTRTLISQAKRPIRSGHNGTAVSSSHVPRLKRSVLKSHVRAVPSRASGARPPADQGRRAVPVGRSLRLARPPANPERKSQGGSRRAQIPSRPTPTLQTSLKKPFEAKNPEAVATYILEVARLTCKTGSNSRLTMTERGMIEDEHNRGQGPSPIGSRRIFSSHIRDPCGCHASGIPSREASSPRNLTNGSDVHRDCPRVFLRCAHKATSQPLSNGTRTSTWIYPLTAPGKRRYSPIEGSTAQPTPPPSERMNEGCNY